MDKDLKKIIDVEGRRIRTAYDDGDGGLIIETKEDITPIIERNKAEYNQYDQRARWGEELFDPKNKVATIPLVLFDELNKQGICRGFHIIDQKRFKAWLNDPENRHFRTRPGRV